MDENNIIQNDEQIQLLQKLIIEIQELKQIILACQYPHWSEVVTKA